MNGEIIIKVENSRTQVFCARLATEELLLSLFQVLEGLAGEVALRHHCENIGCDVIPICHGIIKLTKEMKHEEEKEKK